VTSSGSLIGDVRVARLTIQDGATFSGKVSMGAVAAAPAKATETKPVVPEAKAVASEPAVQAEGKATAPIASPPIAAPPVAPPPAAKAPTVPPPAAKTPTVLPKTQPPKGKPKGR
jgi:hypothetical protein